MKKKKVYHSNRIVFYFENTWAHDQYKEFHLLPSISIVKCGGYSIQFNWLCLHIGVYERRQGQILLGGYEEVKI